MSIRDRDYFKYTMKHEWQLLEILKDRTLEAREEKFRDIYAVVVHLFLLSDIGEDIARAEGSKIPYFTAAISARSYLGFMYNLLFGDYHSAARSLRWLYETNLAAAAALISPELLHKEFSGKSSIDISQFDNWLDLYDKREVKFRRKCVLKGLGLPVKDLNDLYSHLCKHTHISKVSYDGKTWPKLYFDEEKFDEIYFLTMRTLDLILLLLCHMLLLFNGETKTALKKYLKWFTDSKGEIFMVPKKLFTMTIRFLEDL